MTTLNKFLHLLKVLFVTNRSVFAVTEKGFSITWTEVVHNISGYCPEINTVIDVGANQGQFALAITDKFPKATIHSFEPLSDICDILTSNTKHKKQIHTYNLPLGSTSGQLNLYKNNYPHASSALPLSDLPTLCLLSDDPQEWAIHLRTVKDRGGVPFEARKEIKQYARQFPWDTIAAKLYSSLQQFSENKFKEWLIAHQ